MIIFETERLYTREMDHSDYQRLADILQDPEVMHAYEHAFNDEEVLSWLHNQLDRYKQDGHGLWALILKETSDMIGQCGLTYQHFQGESVLEIGYLLRQDCWHQGYAIEAAQAAKRYAFLQLGCKEVYSIIRDSNIASMNVAIKNGMKVRGRDIRHYYGVDMPHFGFSIRKDEFLGEKNSATP
ncbi:GNAT family N-acetyltransferase [Gracilibacillus alcaliphilus]|uniref:GNAT family N-acetyltransferase n=1 Tax=Gracilibacillus alcaliphilus TaxID=1401441 RepID=UPI001EF9259A|nr:GNAT family N-acetyltransferase [Gracilibacillus alcaliphilus]MBM7676414.1 RimJ/RimL family protein N-acetyltransferase [Gracilibacillus alcaliphilus]